MSYLVVTPAYGRDYNSAKAAVADWNANKDFEIASFGPDMGRKVNKADLAGTGTTVNIRYKRLTKVTVVKPG